MSGPPNPGFPEQLQGRRIGAYEVIEPLGRGGMGVVLRVRSVRDGSERAMKLVLGDQRLRTQRFAREIEVSRRLRHPHLVPVEEWGNLDGRAWFVMPLVPGEDLSGVLRRGPLDPTRAAELVATIARAVHHAHEQGVIHRDIKPGNIRIAPDGQPYLLDFGMAKDHEAAEALSRTGVALGTPAYWAPEQARAQHDRVDARTDVYALGAVLFQMLTGRSLFVAANTHELVHAILHDDPPRPSSLRPGVPPTLDAVCLRCLSKDPAERYPSALALAEALEGRAAAAGASPWGWIVGAVVGCGLLGLALGSLAGEPSPPPPTTPATPAPSLPLVPVELPIPRDELVAAALQAQQAPTRDDFLAALLQLERRLTSALPRAEPAAAAELRLHRGRARRALGRWEPALDDLLAAAEAPQVAAEASLARAVILLRREPGQPAAAAATFQQLQAAQDAPLVARVASSYLLIEAGQLPAAAQALLELLQTEQPAPLRAEAHLALGLAAHRAAEAGQAPLALSWLDAAAGAGDAPQHAYLFLSDRAAVRASAGRIAEAEADLREAELTDPDAWAQTRTRLLLLAAQGRLQSLRDAREPTLAKASVLGRDAAQTEAWLDALELQAREASAPPAGAGVSVPGILTLPAEPERLDLLLPGGQQLVHLVFDVQGDVACFELYGADEDVDLWFRRDDPPRHVAEATLAAAGPAFAETLYALRLRPGIHHLVVARASPSPAPLGMTLVQFAPRPGTATVMPWPWVRDDGLPFDDAISEELQAALDAWGTSDTPEIVRRVEALEAKSPRDRACLRFVRAELLLLTNAAAQARDLLDALGPAPDPPLHRRVPFLAAQVAMSLGQPARALALLEPLLAREPRLVDALYLRAEAALGAGDLALVERTLATLDGHEIPGWHTVLEGELALARGDREGALARLSLHPGLQPSLRAVRGATIALLRMGEAERALQLIEGHASRWGDGEVLAVERCACLRALGRDGSPPPPERLHPMGRARLAGLARLVDRRR